MAVFQSPVALPHIPDDLSIPQFFLRAVTPGRPARPKTVPWFIDDTTGREIFYEEVHHRTYGLANGLSLELNFQQGDAACLFSPNHVDYGVAIWAVHTLGGIITPANPSYTVDELTHQLTTSRAKLVIVHPTCLKVAQDASRAAGLSQDRIIIFGESAGRTRSFRSIDQLVKLGSAKPENYHAQRFAPGESRTRIAFLSFSSGTTGKPKAIAISHYAVIANALQKVAHTRLDDPSAGGKRLSVGDVALGILPFYHIYGLVVSLHFLTYAGLTLLVVPKFNFTDFLRSVTKYKVSQLFLVPPQIVLMCKHPAAKDVDFTHVKLLISGAAPLSDDLVKQITVRMPNALIGQGFGMTETATVSWPLMHTKVAKLGSSGPLIPGMSAKVVTSDGKLAKEGERGELWVKGPCLAMGYYENPKATAETFVDGWLRTGDEVFIQDLEVYVVDRLKELIKVRGFQVAPAELEGHLLEYPDVADACVVGLPDEYSGELPLAFVVLTAKAFDRVKGDPRAVAALKETLKKHVSDSKVHYKKLAGGVVFIDVIPKSPAGKILRRVLRDSAKDYIKKETLSSKL